LSKIVFRSGSSVLEECCEFLYLVSTASENGIMRFYESRGIKIVASQLPSMQDGMIFLSAAPG